jgi:hypothetical protein
MSISEFLHMIGFDLMMLPLGDAVAQAVNADISRPFIQRRQRLICKTAEPPVARIMTRIVAKK